MPTRIVFADGVQVTVKQEAEEVRERLSADQVRTQEPFTKFDAMDGSDVFVASGHVAYLAAPPAIDLDQFRVEAI